MASAVGLPWGSDTQTKLAASLKVTRAEEFPDVREQYQLCLPKQADRGRAAREASLAAGEDGAGEEKAKTLSAKIDFWGTKPPTY